jgi:phosphate transport system permease protein
LGLFEAYSTGQSGATLTVSLYVYAKERGDFDTAFAIATILLLLTFVINLSARLVAKSLKRGDT